MNQAVEAIEPRSEIAAKIDAALFRNDLSKLSDEERVVHVHNVCRSLGLNPATQPFSYITLNGKLTLYAKRDACDQLRKIHGVNLEIVSRTVTGELLTVHVRAKDKTGRIDEEVGVVSVAGLRGENAANAMMKAVTKAKRRATLSIVGLGFSDETEVENIPDTVVEPAYATGSREVQIEPGPHMLKGMPATETDDRSGDPNIENIQADAEPFELERADDSAATWSAWATQLLAFVKGASTAARIDRWIVANSDSLEALKHYDAGKFNRLRHMIQAVQDAKARAATDDTQ